MNEWNNCTGNTKHDKYISSIYKIQQKKKKKKVICRNIMIFKIIINKMSCNSCKTINELMKEDNKSILL